MTPIVSLIIPVYNAQQYLPACLDAVAAQTVFAQTQVLLIDDGSTDDSPQLCDAFAAQHANVQVQHRQNAGVSAARNAGIDAAEGTYIAFADADDQMEPELLERMCAAVEQTGAQLAMCAYVSDPPQGLERTAYPFAQDVAFPIGVVTEFMLEYESCNTLWNKLFVRRIIEASALRMTVGKRVGEDREFILRYIAHCSQAVYIDYTGYFYRTLFTSAIRRPQAGYAALLTQQYTSDMQLFPALGYDRETLVRRCAPCFCKRICATIDLIFGAFSGRALRRTLREMYADAALQEILRTLLPYAEPKINRFSVGLLRRMRRRSVIGTCVWQYAMRCRMAVFKLIKR